MNLREAARVFNKPFIGSVAGLLMLGGGVAFIGAWTLGFSAFTSYSYALMKAGPVPRAAPDISFIDQFGNRRQLASLRGRYVLLHVFYGSCSTICPIAIEQLRGVYSDLPAAKRRKLVILSISVDPVRDMIEHLRDLWHDEGAFEGWIMAQPADRSISRIAQKFGIWVFARNDGTINHSADFFLIDPGGRLIRIIPLESNGDRMKDALEKYL